MMVRNMRRAFLATAMAFAAALSAAAPTAEAQSVLTVARGLQSNNISVFIDRAVVMESNVRFLEVSVANPEIADVSPLSDRSVYIFGRRQGATTLTLLGENGRLITNVTIKVEPDHADLKQRLQQLLPKERIEVRTAGPGLVLSGMLSGKQKIDSAMALARAYAGEAVVNMMTVGGTQQVMLKVRVAEMNRNVGKELGVSLGLLGATSNFAPELFSGSALSPGGGARSAPTSGATAPGGVGTVPTRLFGPAGSFLGAFGAIFTVANNFIVDLQIDALEAKGFAKVLAEPNLVALSGRQAKFLAGGEVPIPIRGEDGEIEVQFKPVGVGLNFVPRVLDNDLINLDISVEVSDVDPNLGSELDTIDIPGFQVRRTDTTIELRDGQAFAISGLFREDFADTVSQVPWLGDVPILGALFRSADFARNQSELVIIASAHLVVPVDSESDLSIPNDRIRIPNESQLFLLGQTHEGADGGTGLGLGLTGVGFDGDFGYVVE